MSLIAAQQTEQLTRVPWRAEWLLSFLTACTLFNEALKHGTKPPQWRVGAGFRARSGSIKRSIVWTSGAI